MNNIMTFEGNYKAVISYDPEIEMFRGEFIGLSGGADFYASDLEGLKEEGQLSLNMFLAMCAKDGVSPRKAVSGKFALRLSEEVYSAASVAAASEGKSLNQWIVDTVRQAIRA